MKRSEINHYINQAKEFLTAHQVYLPPFAFWTAADWAKVGPEADEIRSCRLGWDLTTFGSDDFHKVGLLLFTLRNGRLDDPANRKTYAEKIMIVLEGQVTPWHLHHHKTEDIINRGAGRLVCRLCNSTPQAAFAQTPVVVSCDSIPRTVDAQGTVVLGPGQSITLVPGLYHEFWAERGGGTALIGEVSSINDDATDNHFHDPQVRFPKVEEDQPPVHLLCNEYPAALSR